MSSLPLNPSASFKRLNPHLFPTPEAAQAAHDAVPQEIPLHRDIEAYCNEQWPRWKFVHARTDRKSTIGTGVHDYTIFLPGHRVLCVEVKSKTGKLDDAQQGWRLEMKRLDHEIHVVRSMHDFRDAVNVVLGTKNHFNPPPRRD